MLIPIGKITKSKKIGSARDVHEVLWKLLSSKHRFDQDKEHFYVILISRANKITYIDEVSIGNLNSTIVTSREVFRFAIHKGAEAIIIAHNHPSGSLTPSTLDKAIRLRLVEAGELIGIKVIDSLIITRKGYFSFVEDGILANEA